MNINEYLMKLSENLNYCFSLLFFIIPIVLLFCLTYKKVIFINAKKIKSVLLAVIIYIAVSSILFFLSLPIGTLLKIIIISILVYYSTKALRNETGNNIIGQEEGYYLRLDLLLLFFGILVLSYAGLFFGRGFVHDWLKHRSILLCLYSNPFSPTLDYFDLPVDHSLHNAPLVYYYTMYLPGVYITKFLTLFLKIKSIPGLAWILSFCFFIWHFLGLILLSLLLPVCCNKIFERHKSKTIWGYFYLAIILILGNEYWAKVFNYGRLYVGYADDMHTAPYFAGISPFIILWQFTPNQLIPALLGVVFVCLYKQRIKLFSLCLWSTFLICSSPFCWIGVFPIALYFLYDWKNIGGFFKAMKVEILASIFIASIVGLFYLSKKYPETLAINRSLLSDNGFFRYLFFLLKRLLPAAIILCLSRFKKISIPPVVWLSLGILILLPIFELGLWNDLCVKTSIPALLIVMMFCAYIIQKTMFDEFIITKVFLVVFFMLVIPAFINDFIMGVFVSNPLLEHSISAIKQYTGTGDIWAIFR